MANEVIYSEGTQPLDENLRPIKIGGEVSSLELAQQGDGARINGDLEINGTNIVLKDTLRLPHRNEVGSFFEIGVGESGATTITTNDAGGQTAHLTLDVDGDIISDAQSGRYFFKINGEATDYGRIAIATGTGAMTITTTSAGDDGHITLFPDGDLVFNPASGNFIAKNAGTEFSAANSAYAGMILGYTAIGIDDVLASESLGTSFAVTDATHKVSFVAPPSGNVEIAVSVYADQVSSGRYLQLGLSDNATYNTLDVTHEHFSAKGDETDEEQLHHEWVITGLTAGTSYEYWLGAKAQSSGAYVLYWGGNVTGKMQPFVMKATALPATIYTG